MRGRKLTREQAIEEYFVYRLKLEHFLDLYGLWQDALDEQITPRHGRTHVDLRETLMLYTTASLAVFVDKDTRALNIFDVWLNLYPNDESSIKQVWHSFEQHLRFIRDLRNDVVFHSNVLLGTHFEKWFAFSINRQAIGAAIAEFAGLAAQLIRQESKAVPDWNGQVERLTNKIVQRVPDLNPDWVRDRLTRKEA